MGVLLEPLAVFLEALLAWVIKQLGRLFTAYAIPALLQMSGISLAGQFLMVTAFILVVNRAIVLLVDKFAGYINSLFTFNPAADSLWLCFVSLLPVNLLNNFYIIIMSVSFILGLRLLILFGKLFVHSSANKFSVKTK